MKRPALMRRHFVLVLDYLLKDYHMYEFIVIDTPGSRVSIFPVMAMTASDTVLVPVKTERAATDATEEHLTRKNYSAGSIRFSNLNSRKSDISAINARMIVRKMRPSKPQA